MNTQILEIGQNTKQIIPSLVFPIQCFTSHCYFDNNNKPKQDGIDYIMARIRQNIDLSKLGYDVKPIYGENFLEEAKKAKDYVPSRAPKNAHIWQKQIIIN